jgi:hypothetical protein
MQRTNGFPGTSIIQKAAKRPPFTVSWEKFPKKRKESKQEDGKDVEETLKGLSASASPVWAKPVHAPLEAGIEMLRPYWKSGT